MVTFSWSVVHKANASVSMPAAAPLPLLFNDALQFGGILKLRRLRVMSDSFVFIFFPFPVNFIAKHTHQGTAFCTASESHVFNMYYVDVGSLGFIDESLKLRKLIITNGFINN